MLLKHLYDFIHKILIIFIIFLIGRHGMKEILIKICEAFFVIFRDQFW
jgi:hypothetical protein